MSDHMMTGVSVHMMMAVLIFGLVIAIVAGIVVHSLRRPVGQSLLVADLAAGRSRNPISTEHADVSATYAKAHDTIFILPDISHYTRFMSGNHFAFAHAQHVIFSLINAMIEAATKTVELSKLEGDAALFYVDAGAYEPSDIGDTVMAIFAAFFRQRDHLMRSNLCLCSACSHIASLDLKIFVHRGEAARFEFRGSVDHFGTDVIVLHRLMKNGVKSDRYVMVTEAASDAVELAELSAGDRVEESLEHIGDVRATVYKLDADQVALMSQPEKAMPASFLPEMARKLAENLRSMRTAARWSR